MADDFPLEHRFEGSDRVTYGWWNPEDGIITVEFPDGVRWQYRNCTTPDWTEFINAASPGGYIASILDNKPSGPA